MDRAAILATAASLVASPRVTVVTDELWVSVSGATYGGNTSAKVLTLAEFCGDALRACGVPADRISYRSSAAEMRSGGAAYSRITCRITF